MSFHILVVDEKFFQIFHTSLPAQACSLADVATVMLVAHFLVDLAESLAEHCRLLELAEKCFFQRVGIDHLVAHDELVVDLADFCTDCVEVAVKLQVLFGLAFRLTFGGIPVVGSHIAVGIYLRTLPIHRDTEGYGYFSLLVRSCFSRYEVEREITLIG